MLSQKIFKIMLITIFVLFMLFSQNIYAKITQISTLSSFEKELKNLHTNTLVIFDIDHVIMMPTDAYSLSRNPYRQLLWEKMQKRLSKEELELLYSIITVNAKWRLIDPKIMHILTSLKRTGVPAVALTSFSTGKYGIIEKREDLRIKDLKTLGVNFLDLSPFKEDMVLTELEGGEGVPMLKSGVILTAELNKALVLKQILSKRNYWPQKLIFIDDQLKNLEAVKNLCTELKIPFEGFHYVAVSLMPTTAFNKETEDLRLKTLEEDHRWLTDEQIK